MYSGFSLDDGYAPFQLPVQGFRGIHSMLNNSVTGFCFESKLRKSSDDLFLVDTKEN